MLRACTVITSHTFVPSRHISKWCVVERLHRVCHFSADASAWQLMPHLLRHGIRGQPLARYAPQQAADLHQVRQGLIISPRLRRQPSLENFGCPHALLHCLRYTGGLCVWQYPALRILCKLSCLCAQDDACRTGPSASHAATTKPENAKRCPFLRACAWQTPS